MLLSLNKFAANVEKYCPARFADVPLHLQLEFLGRSRCLIRQGNQLSTLGDQQAIVKEKYRVPSLYAASLPDVVGESA